MPPRQTDAAAAQQRDRRLLGELLARHAGDEVTATDQAARFETAKRRQDLPPRNGQTRFQKTSRKTTPQRSNNCQATISASSSTSSAAPLLGSSVQRPSAA
jgi:biopolymer transport protein ExbB/TolQ